MAAGQVQLPGGRENPPAQADAGVGGGGVVVDVDLVGPLVLAEFPLERVLHEFEEGKVGEELVGEVNFVGA